MHPTLHAQVSSETKTDGNYTSDMTVVTVEPGGLTGHDEKKIRMLLVRLRAGSASQRRGDVTSLDCSSHLSSKSMRVQMFGQHAQELSTSEVEVLALLSSGTKIRIAGRMAFSEQQRREKCRTLGSTGGS